MVVVDVAVRGTDKIIYYKGKLLEDLQDVLIVECKNRETDELEIVRIFKTSIITIKEVRG